MIGKKHQPSSLAVPVANAPQPFGIALLGVKDDQLHILVANQSRAAIDGPRVDTLEFEVGSGTGNEEALALMEPVEPLEVEISAIHDIEGTRLGDEHIEDVDVVQFAIGNMDETGNRSAQVEQRMEFERRFGSTKLGPRKQRETQVDGGGIQGIDRFGKIHRKGILSIQTTCRADKTLSELRIDTPVPPLVGVCQHTSTHRAPKTHVIELAGLCTKTRLDVAQALAVGQLREGHSQKLVQAAEVRTLKSPRYFLTKRRKVYHGANSMSWAKTRLPLCISTSRVSPERVPKTPWRIQIVNSFECHEHRAKSSLSQK